MAGEFEKLFGPKPANDKPVWPSGNGAGLIPNNVHPGFVPWPFFTSNPSSVLPGKSGLKRAP